MKKLFCSECKKEFEKNDKVFRDNGFFYCYDCIDFSGESYTYEAQTCDICGGDFEDGDSYYEDDKYNFICHDCFLYGKEIYAELLINIYGVEVDG